MGAPDERPGDRAGRPGGHVSEQAAPASDGAGAPARPGEPDLDALRAARLEVVGERGVTFGGRRWVLAAEVPFEFAEAWQMRRRSRCAELILADPTEAGEFMALRPSNEDFDEILKVYRTTPGKSSAS